MICKIGASRKVRFAIRVQHTNFTAVWFLQVRDPIIWRYKCH